jgi:hypothetical protein
MRIAYMALVQNTVGKESIETPEIMIYSGEAQVRPYRKILLIAFYIFAAIFFIPLFILTIHIVVDILSLDPRLTMILIGGEFLGLFILYSGFLNGSIIRMPVKVEMYKTFLVLRWKSGRVQRLNYTDIMAGEEISYEKAKGLKQWGRWRMNLFYQNDYSIMMHILLISQKRRAGQDRVYAEVLPELYEKIKKTLKVSFDNMPESMKDYQQPPALLR